MLDVKKDDRVLLTHPNGDSVNIRVTIANKRCIGTDRNTYTFSDGWEVTEVIEHAKKPLPTEPGLYVPSPNDRNPLNLRHLVLTNKGKWYWLDFTANDNGRGVLEPCYIIENYADTIEPIYTKETN